jgi:cellulose biosynthesis protein BcsQ
MNLKKFLVSIIACSVVGGLVSTTQAQTSPMGQKAAAKGPKQVDDKKLKALEVDYKKAKDSFAKKPKDAKMKKAYIDATFAFGMGNMYSETLPPRTKYKTALTYFREVLKTDPKNKPAKEQYDLIASIYKSMGRPVPQ